MDITFTNGTQEQQDAVNEAFTRLINYDLSEVDRDVTVTFATSTGHTDGNRFAFSTVSGSTASMTIRSDAPVFNDDTTTGFDAGMHARFFREIVVREIGRLLILSLDANARNEIAAMFDTTTPEWNDGEWEDRPLEGILETFKAAFLPGPLRMFHNRTKRSIPLSRYKAFRALVRGQTSLPGASFAQHTVADAFTMTWESGSSGIGVPALYLIDNGSQRWHSSLNSVAETLEGELGMEPAVFETRPASPTDQTIWSIRPAVSMSADAKAHLAARRDRGMTLPVRYREGFSPSPFGVVGRLGSSSLQGLGISVNSMPMQYVSNIIEKYAPLARSTALPYITPAELDDLLPLGTVLTFKFSYTIMPVWRLEDNSLALGDAATVSYDLPFEVKSYTAFSGSSPFFYPGLNGYVPWMAYEHLKFEYVGSDPPRSNTTYASIDFWPQTPRYRTTQVTIHPHATELYLIMVGYPHRDQHQFEPEEPRFSGGSFAIYDRCRGLGKYWISDHLAFPGYTRLSQTSISPFPMSETSSTLPAEILPPTKIGEFVPPTGTILASPDTGGIRRESRPVMGGM